MQCFNIGTLATDCVFFPPSYRKCSCRLARAKHRGENEEEGWSSGNLTLHSKGLTFGPPATNKPPCLSVPEQDAKSPPWSPRPCSVAVLSPQCERLRGRKKKCSPQGINYNVISHYNYYRLLSHRDTPNHQLFYFFYPFLQHYEDGSVELKESNSSATATNYMARTTQMKRHAMWRSTKYLHKNIVEIMTYAHHMTRWRLCYRAENEWPLLRPQYALQRVSPQFVFIMPSICSVVVHL